MQTRFQSFLESCLNILIGYLVALLGQILIFPLYNLKPSIRDNLEIGALFTILSLIRSYALRRLFNRLHK